MGQFYYPHELGKHQQAWTLLVNSRFRRRDTPLRVRADKMEGQTNIDRLSSDKRWSIKTRLKCFLRKFRYRLD